MIKKRFYKKIIIAFLSISMSLSLIVFVGNDVRVRAADNFNLVNVPDHDLITNNQHYIDYNYMLVLLPSTSYKLSYDYNIIDTNASILYASVGYGTTDMNAEIFNDFNIDLSVPEGSIDITFTTPATFMVNNPVLIVRELRGPIAHTSTIRISNIIVQYAPYTYDTALAQGVYNQDGSISENSYSVYTVKPAYLAAGKYKITYFVQQGTNYYKLYSIYGSSLFITPTAPIADFIEITLNAGQYVFFSFTACTASGEVLTSQDFISVFGSNFENVACFHSFKALVKVVFCVDGVAYRTIFIDRGNSLV